MNICIFTNNPLVQEQFSKSYGVKFNEELNIIKLLMDVRDEIHKGSILLTHPLSGSVKPSETPYKSVLIDVCQGPVDMKSLELIEDAIRMSSRMVEERGFCPWSEAILNDFQIVDYDLIRFALQSAL